MHFKGRHVGADLSTAFLWLYSDSSILDMQSLRLLICSGNVLLTCLKFGRAKRSLLSVVMRDFLHLKTAKLVVVLVWL